jgi:predicted nucleic acid-binding protein
MRADYPVVLDTCVLLPPVLCDFLLRLAETPRLYLPKWSQEILDEVHKNQQEVLNFTRARADHWQSQVTSAFPDALVRGYAPLVSICENDVKDRHVLAAAVRGGCHTIITDNLKDFPKDALSNWDVKAVRPSDYLITLYELEPAIVVAKLDDMALRRKRPREEMLGLLSKTVPGFSSAVAGSLGLDIVFPPKDVPAPPT